MATLDQLSADRRAILELVLKRGQSYDDIADMLGMPAARVREHAREALVSLAPRTADRVDSEWRGQLADYVLGQQSGPESKATRGHLKRSEPARAWALSMLDSLGDLYQDGAEPEIPEPDKRAGGRPRRRGGAGAGAGAAAKKPAKPGKGPAGEKERPAKDKERPTAEPARKPDEPLSPEAEAVVRRRRILGAIAGVAALAGLVAIIILVFPVPQITDDEESQTAVNGSPAAQGDAQILAQLELAPVGKANGTGQAIVAEQGGAPQLIVQARLEPAQRNEAYEVWLYNSQDDAVSLGAQVTDDQGNYQGAGPLPENFEDYEFIDISLEQTDENPDHSGESVLRGQIAGGQPAPGAGGAAPPGTETPLPGGTPTLPEGGGAPPSGEPPSGGNP